jgi:hypothetical protein
MNKNNEQTLGQMSHSWIKGIANISSTKPQIPTTTISSAFSVLIHFYFDKFLGKEKKMFCHYILKLMVN